MEFYEILERESRHSLSEQACVLRVLGAVFLRFFICLSLFYLELHLPTQWQRTTETETEAKGSSPRSEYYPVDWSSRTAVRKYPFQTLS
jgi:hypothetical protein